MELLEKNSKNNVSNIYTQEIKKDSDSPNRIPPNHKQMNLKYLQEPETEKHSHGFDSKRDVGKNY